MRLIILKFLYFIVVMCTTYMSREFTSEFPLYNYRGLLHVKKLLHKQIKDLEAVATCPGRRSKVASR
jgi:hypothetical protein